MKIRFFAPLILITFVLTASFFLTSKSKLAIPEKKIPKQEITVDLTSRFPDIQTKLNHLKTFVKNKYNYQIPSDLKFVLIDENETSPILKSTYEDFDKRKIMMGTVEDFYPLITALKLNSANTVFINKKMLLSYLGDNLSENNPTEDQIIVGKIIVHETEHLKQQMILNETGTNITLDKLFWKDGKPTATNRLLEALADARLHLDTTPAYKGEEIVSEINQKKDKDFARLYQIYNIYTSLMNKLDLAQSLDKTVSQKLLQILEDLNNNQSPEERTLLRLN